MNAATGTSWSILVEGYLALRRGLGFKLVDAGRFLQQLARYLDDAGEPTLTVAAALAWASAPQTAQRAYWAKRLSAVRGFATYLQAFDPTTEIPAAELLPHRFGRATPFIYSPDDIAGLLAAADSLKRQLRVETYRTLIGVLAVTGMRVGEAIRLDRTDFDTRDGTVTVWDSKFGKSRQLPLHPSTVAVLRRYARLRDRGFPHPRAAAFFVSCAGTRLFYSNVHLTFQELLVHAQIRPRTQHCRPRIHDLRHTFAVRTLLDWHRTGVDVSARLPLLSTYLGHVAPSSTYWYLTATPELLTAAMNRLERVEV